MAFAVASTAVCCGDKGDARESDLQDPDDAPSAETALRKRDIEPAVPHRSCREVDSLRAGISNLLCKLSHGGNRSVSEVELRGLQSEQLSCPLGFEHFFENLRETVRPRGDAAHNRQLLSGVPGHRC